MIPCTHFAVISSNRLVLPRRARVIVLIEVMELVRGGVSCPVKLDTKSLFETIMLSRELSQAARGFEHSVRFLSCIYQYAFGLTTQIPCVNVIIITDPLHK